METLWAVPPLQQYAQEPNPMGAAAAPVLAPAPAPEPSSIAPAVAPAQPPGGSVRTGKPAAAAVRAAQEAANNAKVAAAAEATQTAVVQQPTIFKCDYAAEFKCSFQHADLEVVREHEKTCVRNPFHPSWVVNPIRKPVKKKKIPKTARMKYCSHLIDMLHRKKHSHIAWPFLKRVDWQKLKWFT